LPPGTILDGRYLVGRMLGQGGYGITYVGCDIRLGFKVAIKEYMPRDLASRDRDNVSIRPYSGEAGKYFRHGLEGAIEEGRHLAKLREHRNVVSVVTYFEANGTGYLVMHYVEGHSLFDMTSQCGGRLLEAEVCEILAQMLDGLRAVHDVGLLHRDIKPANVYITSEGVVQILDFGAARETIGKRSKSLSIQLTPGYAALEQYFTRADRLGPWTDVYGAAATGYRLLTGTVPPEACSIGMMEDRLASPREIMGQEVSEEVSDVLMKGMRERPEQRYQSPTEFRDALMQASEKAERREIGVPPATSPKPPRAFRPPLTPDEKRSFSSPPEPNSPVYLEPLLEWLKRLYRAFKESTDPAIVLVVIWIVVAMVVVILCLVWGLRG
jgi:serine/threonine protein kinase